MACHGAPHDGISGVTRPGCGDSLPCRDFDEAVPNHIADAGVYLLHPDRA